MFDVAGCTCVCVCVIPERLLALSTNVAERKMDVVAEWDRQKPASALYPSLVATNVSLPTINTALRPAASRNVKRCSVIIKLRNSPKSPVTSERLKAPGQFFLFYKPCFYFVKMPFYSIRDGEAFI